MPVQIQLRRGTTAQWSTANPTLASGEVGVDTSLTKFKVGNGSTAWNSLQYATLTYQGTYAGGTTYYPNDVVTYNGSSYIAITQSSGSTPPSANWSLLAQAGTNGTNGTNGISFIWEGAWNNGLVYAPNDVVSYNNSTYICTATTTAGIDPTNTSYWSLMALAGAGDVVGPASSTDSVLAVYDGTTGKLLKNSTMPISSVGYIGSPQVSGGATAYTLALADAGDHVYFTGGSTATLTVPTNATVAFPTGTTILVLNNNSGNLTISGAGVTFQLVNTTSTGNRTVATKGMASLIKVATDTWWVTGPGVT